MGCRGVAFSVARRGFDMRDDAIVRTGKRIDRRAIDKVSDEELIPEVVKLMLSPRRRSVVPLILDPAQRVKEGRKAARDKRSTAAPRRVAPPFPGGAGRPAASGLLSLLVSRCAALLGRFGPWAPLSTGVIWEIVWDTGTLRG